MKVRKSNIAQQLSDTAFISNYLSPQLFTFTVDLGHLAPQVEFKFSYNVNFQTSNRLIIVKINLSRRLGLNTMNDIRIQ